MDQKKIWVVRPYAQSMDSSRAPQELENTLNALYEEGYAIYNINHDYRYVVGALNQNRFVARISGHGEKSADTGTEYKDPQSAHSAKLGNVLYTIIQQFDGTPFFTIKEARQTIDQSIFQIFKDLPRHEVEIAISDFTQLLSDHEENSAKTGKACDHRCNISSVVRIAIECLKKRLESSPLM